MNEEKDRFGDFIRLLERAREDVYFAAKDRDLIDKLNRRLEKARQSQLENPTMKCPRCDVKLRDSTLMDFSVNPLLGLRRSMAGSRRAGAISEYEKNRTGC